MKVAVLFKCHEWNVDVERQFARLKSRSTIGDLFILFDQTRGIDSIPKKTLAQERFFFVSNADFQVYGLEWGMADRGGFWYCGDYANSLFIIKFPDYDFVVSVESDVAVLCDIDNILLDMKKDHIDLVYLPVEIPVERWSHAESCHGYYDLDKYIHKGLFCIAFFSRRALVRIYVARLEMAHKRRSNALHGWPIGECVMIEEIVRSNMRRRDISIYCDSLLSYDWAPSFVESQVEKIKAKTFVHPVAGIEKYVRTNFHQNYKGFTDGVRIRNGEYKDVARVICDLRIYSELYWSHTAMNDRELQQEIYRECLSALRKDFINEQLHGHNIAAHARIRSSSNADWTVGNQVLQSLPTPQASYEVEGKNMPWIEVDLPSALDIDCVIVFLATHSGNLRTIILESSNNHDGQEMRVCDGVPLEGGSVFRFDNIGNTKLLRLKCLEQAKLSIAHFRVVEERFP